MHSCRYIHAYIPLSKSSRAQSHGQGHRGSQNVEKLITSHIKPLGFRGLEIRGIFLHNRWWGLPLFLFNLSPSCWKTLVMFSAFAAASLPYSTHKKWGRGWGRGRWKEFEVRWEGHHRHFPLRLPVPVIDGWMDERMNEWFWMNWVRRLERCVATYTGLWGDRIQNYKSSPPWKYIMKTKTNSTLLCNSTKYILYWLIHPHFLAKVVHFDLLEPCLSRCTLG